MGGLTPPGHSQDSRLFVTHTTPHSVLALPREKRRPLLPAPQDIPPNSRSTSLNLPFLRKSFCPSTLLLAFGIGTEPDHWVF